MNEEAKTLDLAKRVRFTRGKEVIRGIFPSFQPGKYLVEYEDCEGCFSAILVNARDVENIPELKVIEGIVSVHQYINGEPYLTTDVPENLNHSIKITYTEGAEFPWAIKEIIS